MADFFDKEEYSIDDIQMLINTKAEESLTLEFKSAGSLENKDSKKKELAKDVSSFANSAGGIIIYGLEEVDHVATNFSFVDGNAIEKEWIENVINSNISRKIPDLRIFPIRVDGDLMKTIYVVKIPESYSAPHMVLNDNRFYKRKNFKCEPMDEYEVRALYYRSKYPRLEVLMPRIINCPNSLGKEEPSGVKLQFKVKNNSSVTAINYKLEVIIPHEIRPNPVDYAAISESSVSSEGSYDQWKIYGQKPIFPFEEIVLFTYKILLYSDDVYGYGGRKDIFITIHYDGGRKGVKRSIKEIYKANVSKQEGFTLLLSDIDL
jgi:hypothetical protein